MTWSAKANQVIEKVCLVFELKVAATFDVMNIKVSSAWAMACTAIMTNLVSLYDLKPDTSPIAPALKFFATAPMCAVRSDHMSNGALSGAILAPILNGRGERSKFFSTMGTRGVGIFARAYRLTLAGTKLCSWANNRLTTDGTRRGLGLFASPGRVTFRRAKGGVDFPALEAMGWTLELFSALVTFERDVIASVGTTLRAMVNAAVICLELFSAMEAGFDHRSC